MVGEFSMKEWLLDIIVCPDPQCRSKLNITVFEEHEIETEDSKVREIDEALLTCPSCGRWYPVINGIACLLPDEDRKDPSQLNRELSFLKRWKDRIPKEILENGKPFGYSEPQEIEEPEDFGDDDFVDE